MFSDDAVAAVQTAFRTSGTSLHVSYWSLWGPETPWCFLTPKCIHTWHTCIMILGGWGKRVGSSGVVKLESPSLHFSCTRSAPPPQISMSILSVRSSLSGWVRPPPFTGRSPCVVPKSDKGSQSRAFFSPWVPCTGGHKCWHSHHKGVFCRRPVGETWKGSGCFLDAAGHSQGVGAQGGGHGQVGKLRVKVSEVCGAGLWNHAERTGIRWEFIRTILVKWLRLFLLHKCEDCQLR